MVDLIMGVGLMILAGMGLLQNFVIKRLHNRIAVLEQALGYRV